MRFPWRGLRSPRESGIFLLFFILFLRDVYSEEADVVELTSSGYGEMEYEDVNDHIFHRSEKDFMLYPTERFQNIQHINKLAKAKVLEAKLKSTKEKVLETNEKFNGGKFQNGEISLEKYHLWGQVDSPDFNWPYEDYHPSVPFQYTDNIVKKQHGVDQPEMNKQPSDGKMSSKHQEKNENTYNPYGKMSSNSNEKYGENTQNDDINNNNDNNNGNLQRHFVTVNMQGACCPTQTCTNAGCSSSSTSTSSSQAITDQLRELRSDVQFSVNSLSTDLMKQLDKMQQQLLAGMSFNNRPDIDTAAQSGSKPLGTFSPCPPGFTPFQNSCYLFELKQTDWVSANQMCKDLYAASLVSIESEAEQKFLKNHIKRNKYKPDIPYKYWGFWTGGTDLDREGVWIWHGANKKPVTYTAWGGNQPDNNYCRLPEGCMHMVKLYDYAWNDLPCFINLNSFICEKPQRGVIHLMPEETLTKYRK